MSLTCEELTARWWLNTSTTVQILLLSNMYNELS